MRRHRSLLVLAAAVAATSAAAAADCGSSVPCRVAGGEYRIEPPPDRPAVGVLVFFHGYRGSAEGQMNASGLVAAAHRRGLAFAAPDGLGGTWSHPGSPSRQRDETAFVGAVLDDLSARFGFGPDDVLVGGFSQGASMADYVVCDFPRRVAGAVTFAGVFWAPLPAAADCPGPTPPVVHFHGRADRTFPLEGRPVGARWRQGGTVESLDLLRRAGACGPAVAETIAGVGCEVTACGRGPIALCLHPGGHEIRAEWLEEGVARLRH